MNRREFTEAVLVVAATAAVAPVELAEPLRIVGRYILRLSENFRCVVVLRSDGVSADFSACKSYDDEKYAWYERAFLGMEWGPLDRRKTFKEFSQAALGQQRFWQANCTKYPHEVLSLEEL